jgi:hypothetical protein
MANWALVFMGLQEFAGGSAVHKGMPEAGHLEQEIRHA